MTTPVTEALTVTQCPSCLGDGVDGISFVGVFACARCGGKGTVKQNLTVEPLSKAQEFDLDQLDQWVSDGCPEGVSGIPSQVARLIAFARHRLTHTTPTEPVLRWEGDQLWLGGEVVARVSEEYNGRWFWDVKLGFGKWGRCKTLPEAKTAAEQAVRDWLSRAGLVRQGGEVVAWEHCRVGSCQRHKECMYSPCRAHPPASPTAEVVEAISFPPLRPTYSEDHPILAAILDKRRFAASQFTPEFSGTRGQDFDRGLMCAYEAVNAVLQEATAALAKVKP